MAYTIKSKWLIAGIIALLLANIVSLAVFWLAPRGRKDAAHPEMPAVFLTRELGLDAQQQAAYQELIKEHRGQADTIKGHINEARKGLFTLMQEGHADSLRIDVAAAEIAAWTKKMDIVTFSHFMKVRQLCRPDQQQKFDEVIEEVMQMIARPAPPAGMDPNRGAHRPPPMEGPPPPEK